MLNKLRFILDIGTSKISLLAVSRLGKTDHIVAESTVLYDGYVDGEFLSPNELETAFSFLIEDMSTKTRKQVNVITIGVPSEFCICVCKRITRKFISPHKITDGDITELYDSNLNFGDSNDYLVINYSPMQFVLDDEVKTMSPVGKSSSNLTLDASFILAKKSFIDLMIEKFNKLSIHNVDFISTALAQGTLCAKINKTTQPIIVVDVGHISTSVAVLKGEGLALLSSFSMGGGHISSDIMQVLGMSFKDAEMIKRKVILTIESEHNDYYEVCFKGNLIKAPIHLTNQIVKSRIEMIAKVISDILSIDQVFASLPIYITGDGICKFVGAKSVVRDVTKHEVFDFTLPFDNSKEKFQTSKLGLAMLAGIVK